MNRLTEKFSANTTGITIARVIIAAIVLKDLLIYTFNSEVLFGSNAITTRASYRHLLELSGVSWMQLPFENSLFTRLFLAAAILMCVLFMAGYAKKITGLVLCFVLVQLKLRNIYIMDGSDNVIWIMLPFLAFAPSSRLRPGFLKKLPAAAPCPGPVMAHIEKLAAAGIVLQLCLIYFFTAIAKMMVDIWQDGTALYYILRLEDFRSSGMNILLTRSSFFVQLVTYGTLVWELLFPFLIWHRKTRNAVITVSVIMHLGIFLFMRIDNFSLVMISLYPVLFSNSELAAAAKYVRNAVKTGGRKQSKKELVITVPGTN